MDRLRLVPLPVAALVLISACGDDPAGGVAVPGAPAAVTTIVARTTAPTTTTLPASTTTVTSTTIAAPTTTAATPTPTTAPPITDVAASTTTVPVTTVPAPTTTALVYVEEAPTGTLRFGMEGPRSLQLQRDLITLGFLPAGADDGLYGSGTAGGVRRFQEAAELIIDGVAGPVTQAAIAEALAAAEAAPPPDE